MSENVDGLKVTGAMENISWQAQAQSPLSAISLDLRFENLPQGIDLSEILLPTEQKVISLKPEIPLPRAISIFVANPRVRVCSFTFDDPLETRALTSTDAERPSGQLFAGVGQQRKRLTRIKTPGDVIKLEDRMHYLLQPSLESLLSEGALGFPCRPYPYQFEGMAFLYPRQAAILADEMGLGKTMQAITAIRLLLHRGEMRRVLLVCPKSLVTTWRREFHMWAPELPVMVIEGDQSKRA